MIEAVTIDTPPLGDRTYLATDGAGALVAGPRRDTGPVLAVAAARAVAVTHVFETRIHHDYACGGLALARRCGAAYHVSAAAAVASGRVRIAGGDTGAAGRSMRVRVIATPGHTFTHLAYALEDAATGEVAAAFTGGSLLHGRPAARTCPCRAHARARGRSAHLGPGASPGSCQTGRAATLGSLAGIPAEHANWRD